MSATDTTKDNQAVLDEFQVRLVEAAGRRIREKDEAKRRWRAELRQADVGLVEVVREARDSGVPWNDICRAVGISRQPLAFLVARTETR